MRLLKRASRRKADATFESIRTKAWLLLSLYRWLNLAMVLLFILIRANMQTSYGLAWLLFAITVLYTAALTALGKKLWQTLDKRPFLLLIDIGFAFALTSLSGGWRSPYYLYSLSPVLTAAVLFGLGRSLVVAVFSGVGFWLTVYLDGYGLGKIIELDWLDDYISGFISYLLVAVVFSYPATLVKELAASNAELERTRTSLAAANDRLAAKNRQLLTMQVVAAAMQASLDLRRVLSTVMQGLAYGLGLDNVLIGLAGEAGRTVSDWYEFDKSSTKFSVKEIEDVVVAVDKDTPLSALIEKRSPALLGQVPENALPHPALLQRIGTSPVILVPLWVGDEWVGLLLCPYSDELVASWPRDEELLTALVSHVSLGIHNARLYRGAQELAAMRERHRIAMEIHDGLSQTISGAKLIAGSCRRLLETDVAAARRQLDILAQVLDRSFDETRQAISNLRLPSLAQEGMSAFMKRLLREFEQYSGVKASIRIEGSDDYCSEEAAFCMCRVFQEVLANTMKHASAKRLWVRLSIVDGSITMTTKDDGRGFEVERALSAAEKGKTFGILALRERVESLGGELSIKSSVGKGVETRVRIPLRAREVTEEIAPAHS